MMNDGYNGFKAVVLLNNTALAATGYTNYIDLHGYNKATFVVYQNMATVDSSNYMTPTLQEASATPASSASYSAVGSTNYVGSLSAVTTTTAQVEEISYVGDNRYVCIKLTETGTAVGQFTVLVILQDGRHEEIASDSPTSGTVT